MFHVSAQGVDELMIHVHYHYYLLLLLLLLLLIIIIIIIISRFVARQNSYACGQKAQLYVQQTPV